jgi:diaminohydroxyphosphoribosylaminopyrimidine deaminase / 5-amino-6-(5-phosphoribosylamino)uracil reductase
MDRYMERALELAAEGRYSVSPNPMVGCVIVKDGRVIGEGFHFRAGEPHAEINALNACSESPEGATMYVNLEPCAHHGRTPPCVDAVLGSGIRRLVVGTIDHKGGGDLEKIRAAGLEVELGVMRDEAERLNEKFLHAASTRLPFVLLKAGMTLDGKLATVTGESQWITSPESRDRSLELREEYDAVLVGSGTVAADNPFLTRRLAMNSSIVPWTRVVLDASGSLPESAQILNDGRPTIVYTSEPDRFRHSSAVEVISAEQHEERIDLLPVLQDLHAREIRSIVVEGGAAVHSDFISRRLWQKMVLFVAPIIVGGGQAPAIFSDAGIESLADAFRLRFDSVERVGCDIMITAYPY